MRASRMAAWGIVGGYRGAGGARFGCRSLVEMDKRERERDISIARMELGMAGYPLEPNKSGQEDCQMDNVGQPRCAAGDVEAKVKLWWCLNFLRDWDGCGG
jgi:hypothetical protein